MIRRTKLARYRQMLREARNLGFVDEYHDRETKGCPSVVQMRVQRGNRFLSIQFWGNGKHRISHGEVGPYGDRSSLEKHGAPTDFSDLRGMYRAIAFEWQRLPPEASPA